MSDPPTTSAPQNVKDDLPSAPASPSIALLDWSASSSRSDFQLATGAGAAAAAGGQSASTTIMVGGNESHLLLSPSMHSRPPLAPEPTPSSPSSLLSTHSKQSSTDPSSINLSSNQNPPVATITTTTTISQDDFSSLATAAAVGSGQPPPSPNGSSGTLSPRLAPTDVAGLSAELVRVKNVLAAFKATNKKLESQVRTLTRRKEALQASVKALQHDVASERASRFVIERYLQERTRRMEMDAEFREQECAELRDRVNALEEEIENVRWGSSSSSSSSTTIMGSPRGGRSESPVPGSMASLVVPVVVKHPPVKSSSTLERSPTLSPTYTPVNATTTTPATIATTEGISRQTPSSAAAMPTSKPSMPSSLHCNNLPQQQQQQQQHQHEMNDEAEEGYGSEESCELRRPLPLHSPHPNSFGGVDSRYFRDHDKQVEEEDEEEGDEENDEHDSHGHTHVPRPTFFEAAVDRLFQEFVSDASAATVLVDIQDLLQSFGAMEPKVLGRSPLEAVAEALLRFIEARQVRVAAAGKSEAIPEFVEKCLSKYSPLISHFIESETDEQSLLRLLECACTRPPSRVGLFRTVLLTLYKLELVEPSTVLSWFNEPTTAVDMKAAEVIRSGAKGFVEWLKSQEEEEEEEEEEELSNGGACGVLGALRLCAKCDNVLDNGTVGECSHEEGGEECDSCCSESVSSESDSDDEEVEGEFREGGSDKLLSRGECRTELEEDEEREDDITFEGDNNKRVTFEC